MLTEPMKGKRGPLCGLAISEVMTILLMFQSSRVRDFKNFYLGLLSCYYKGCFPKLPCYAHFIRLMQRAIFPLCIFTQLRAGRQIIAALAAYTIEPLELGRIKMLTNCPK